jgi:hypothetical protein
MLRIYAIKNHALLGEKMANLNNPLRQYFRRPSIYIKLPSKGKYYPEGAIELPEGGEIPVYPMTAIDEITSKTPDALFNGMAITDLIKSCAPAIKDPWALPICDLDTILIAIRAATNGNDLDIESTCGACQETSKYGVNLVGLLAQIDSSGYDQSIQMGDLSIKFKPMDYRHANQSNLDQFELQRQINQLETIESQDDRTAQSSALLKKLTDMNVSLIANTIDSIATPSELVTNKEYISEYLKGCDRKTFDTIRSTVVKLRDSCNTKPLKIKCVSCEHEYEQQLALNSTDFFE